MKNLFLIFMIATLSSLSVNAQEVKFGVKGGVNLASINGDEADSFDGRTSLHFGAVAEIMVSEKFAVQPELLYSAQGADYKETGFEGTVKLDYLNIPVLAKFFVADGFSIQAGPQVGLLLSAKDEYDATDGESGEDDIKDDAKGIDIAAVLGVGYQMESGLNFGARYNVGLSKINDFESDSEFDTSDIKWKNGVIQVFVGFMF